MPTSRVLRKRVGNSCGPSVGVLDTKTLGFTVSRSMNKHSLALLTGLAGLFAGLVVCEPSSAQGRQPALGIDSQSGPDTQIATTAASMLACDTPATSQSWTVTPLFTVGETIKHYQPAGILDGIGAFPAGGNKVDVLVNLELNPEVGYPYQLKNGTMLTGARVSSFRIKRSIAGGTAVADIKRAGLAYDTIYDRSHAIVTDPAQVNETGNAIDGGVAARSRHPSLHAHRGSRPLRRLSPRLHGRWRR